MNEHKKLEILVLISCTQLDPDELSLEQISMPAHQNPCRPNFLDNLQKGNLQEPGAVKKNIYKDYKI